MMRIDLRHRQTSADDGASRRSGLSFARVLSAFTRRAPHPRGPDIDDERWHIIEYYGT